MSVAGCRRACCAAELYLGPELFLFIAIVVVVAAVAEPHTWPAPRSDSSPDQHFSLITAERPGIYSDDETVRPAALYRCAAGHPSGLVVGPLNGASR